MNFFVVTITTVKTIDWIEHNKKMIETSELLLNCKQTLPVVSKINEEVSIKEQFKGNFEDGWFIHKPPPTCNDNLFILVSFLYPKIEGVWDFSL